MMLAVFPQGGRAARVDRRVRPRAVKRKAPAFERGAAYPDRRQIRIAGGAVRVSRMFHPRFRAVETTERLQAKVLAPAMVRKPPEIFVLTFIMRRSRSPRLLVKGTLKSWRKRRTSSLNWCSRFNRLCPGRRGVRPRAPAARLSGGCSR